MELPDPDDYAAQEDYLEAMIDYFTARAVKAERELAVGRTILIGLREDGWCVHGATVTAIEEWLQGQDG